MAETSSTTYQLYATLPAQISAQIGRAIVEGEFKPGQKLREVDLAQSFGVSRASVREALRMVESEGLVTILPQRGAQVTALSVEELRDVFDIRASLMGLVSQRLAASATPEICQRLGELLKELRVARDDADAYGRASLAMTEYCVRQAGSKRLTDLIMSFNRADDPLPQTISFHAGASPALLRQLERSRCRPCRRQRRRGRATVQTTRHGNPRHGIEDANCEGIERAERTRSHGARDMQ